MRAHWPFPLLTASMIAVATVAFTRHDHAGTGLLRLRQYQRPAGGDRVHRRASRREIGAGPADQPVDGKPLRRFAPGSRLQPGAHRRGRSPVFPSNTGAGGVLFPIVLSIAKGAGSEPGQSGGPPPRRLSDVLHDGRPGRLFGPVAHRHLCQPDYGVQIARRMPGSRSASAVGSSPPQCRRSRRSRYCSLVSKIFPPGIGATPEAPAAARKDLAAMGSMSRDEWITAAIFVVMVAGWVFMKCCISTAPPWHSWVSGCCW